MEGVIRLQNSKNLKHSANLEKPGERLIQDFLAEGACITGVVSLQDLFVEQPGDMGSQTVKELPTTWKGLTDCSVCFWRVCDSRLLAELSS